CTSSVCAPLATGVLETDGTSVRRRPAGGTPTGGSAAAGPGAGGVPRSASVRAQAVGQGREDLRRHQVGDVATPGGDLLDQGGRQEAVGGVGGDEEGLDAGEAVVHLGHLQFVVEVADRAQALDDGGDVALLAEVDEEAVEGLDTDVAVLGGDPADQVDPLLDLEQPFLGLVDHHRDVDLVVQPGGPGDDVEVSIGDRVERPGAYGAAHW